MSDELRVKVAKIFCAGQNGPWPECVCSTKQALDCPECLMHADAAHCAGSRCMAWRWRLDQILKTDDTPDAPVFECYTSVHSTTHGYCGLAGRP